MPRRWERQGVYTVEIFDPDDAGKITRAARTLGFQILSQEPKAHHILVQSTERKAAQKKQIEGLAAVHGVRYIRQRVVPRPANNVATAIMGNKYTALSPKGLNLTSEGEIIAVCDTGLDTGDPSTIHPDFAGRIKAIKSYPISADWKSAVTNVGADDGPADLDSGHGTHVSGSVLGNVRTQGRKCTRRNQAVPI
ncbi:MAG: S8 family serine peptidase [Bryobacteraceae bacterium]